MLAFPRQDREMSDKHATRVPSWTETLDLEQLRRDILRAVRTICPRWLADQADDLAQIAISRLLDRLRATDGRLEVTPGYLYRIAYTVTIDEIRRRRRSQETSLEQDLPAQYNDGNPEHPALAREKRDAIVKCLTALGRPRRRAVTLHLLGHSVAEISKLLECRHKQAENLVYRGVGNLRDCLRRSGVTA